jgi:hypothetical protein
VEKEKEHTLKSAQEMGKEEHSMEFLINCSKGDEQRTTAKLEPATEEKVADSMDFPDLCEELEALGKRVITQSRLIQ